MFLTCRMHIIERRSYLHSLRDEDFDLAYPRDIRQLSSRHWTPAKVARSAARFLVDEPGTRVLDIGCGPGKFCIVGALSTTGHFTGVEQRARLARIGRSVIEEAGIPNAQVIHGNITEVDFSNFDSFYLFNPFAENLLTTDKIDSTVELSKELYCEYSEHVALSLAMAPIGTRVATYWGSFEEIPLGYRFIDSSPTSMLKFWQKNRDVGMDELAGRAPEPARRFNVFGPAFWKLLTRKFALH